MSFKESLKSFILSNLIEDGEQVEIDFDDPLIRRGIIDSMGILQLVHMIEEETGIRVPDQEVQLENFQSISSIERMVQRLAAKTRDFTG